MCECRNSEREQAAGHFGAVMLACMVMGLGVVAGLDVFVWGLEPSDDPAFPWLKVIVAGAAMAPFVVAGLWLGLSDPKGGTTDDAR